MTMPIEMKGLASIVCAAGVILAGCAGPGEFTRHYVINAPDQQEAVRPASAQEGPIIAVRPVTLPEYLNQNGIVVRDRDNEIERAEFHVWAAPLSEEIARAVAENLSTMLSTDRVTLSAARRSIPIDYTVDIEIVNFERGLNTNAVDLLARWVVFRGDEKSMLAMRRSRIQRSVAGSDYRDTVAAMSAAVTALSEEIAMTIDRSRDRRKSDRWAAERPSRSLSGDAPGARVRRR
jgi:uncharacterized lipoprotein YmbA